MKKRRPYRRYGHLVSSFVKQKFIDFFSRIVVHYILDDGEQSFSAQYLLTYVKIVFIC